MADSEETTTTTTEAAVVTPPPATEAVADDFDKDRAMATIKNLREFEKAAKAQLKELEQYRTAETQRKQAEMTELERQKEAYTTLQTKHEQTEAQLKRANLRDAATDAAAKATLTFAPGALQDALALGVFDALEFSETGQPKGMTTAIKELAQARPYLFVAATPPAGGIGATEKGKPEQQSNLSSLGTRWGIKTG